MAANERESSRNLRENPSTSAESEASEIEDLDTSNAPGASRTSRSAYPSIRVIGRYEYASLPGFLNPAAIRSRSQRSPSVEEVGSDKENTFPASKQSQRARSLSDSYSNSSLEFDPQDDTNGLSPQPVYPNQRRSSPASKLKDKRLPRRTGRFAAEYFPAACLICRRDYKYYPSLEESSSRYCLTCSASFRGLALDLDIDLAQKEYERVMADQKLFWNSDNVRDVAESVGISSLNEEAVRALSQEVEYRLGQVISEARRFMHQSKRTVLTTQDVSQALKVLDVEPLYGYESTRPLRFGEASLGPGQPLFYIEDEEVDFEKLINAPLPKVPRDMSFTAHWLAVEGVQPSIPQNPTTAEARSTELAPKGSGANPSLAALAGSDNTTIKPLVKHILSKELILFFNKVSMAVLDEDPDQDVVLLRHSALESVRSDPGLHQLVPYFISFVSEKVTHNLNNTFVLRQMMELEAALISNPTLHIDPYVNSLIPPALTCLIGKSLGPEGTDLKEQYDLRDFSSSLLAKITKKYAASSKQLGPRVGRTLFTTFCNYDASLGAHYGAVKGLVDVGGVEVIRQLIINNLDVYDAVIDRAIKQRGEGDAQLQRLIECVMKAISSIVDSSKKSVNGMNGNADMSQAIEDYIGPHIGKRVVALGNHELIKTILEVKEEEAKKQANQVQQGK